MLTVITKTAERKNISDSGWMK